MFGALTYIDYQWFEEVTSHMESLSCDQPITAELCRSSNLNQF